MSDERGRCAASTRDGRRCRFKAAGLVIDVCRTHWNTWARRHPASADDLASNFKMAAPVMEAT